jgi:hypothetical protein
MRLTMLSLILATGAVLIPVAANADTPGQHPAYLHARSDLRTAQFYLRGPIEPNVKGHMRAADHEIDAAIRELDQAALFDRKNLNDHPSYDTNLDRRSRFHNAMDLLVSARRDIAREEDNPNAIGWRDGAFRHIDAAIAQVKRAAHDLQMDRELGW